MVVAGVAVSRGGLVGLDAESSSRLTKYNPVDLARRRFSEREFAVLTGEKAHLCCAC